MERGWERRPCQYTYLCTLPFPAPSPSSPLTLLVGPRFLSSSLPIGRSKSAFCQQHQTRGTRVPRDFPTRPFQKRSMALGAWAVVYHLYSESVNYSCGTVAASNETDRM